MIDNTARLRELMSQLAELVTEFERLAPGRSFTPDGHLVGSIGELIAKSEHGLELAPASTKGYDATRIAAEGEARTVESKATQGASIALRHTHAPATFAAQGTVDVPAIDIEKSPGCTCPRPIRANTTKSSVRVSRTVPAPA